MIDLKNYSTSDLVEELKNRDGVIYEWVHPEECYNAHFDGPCIVLTIYD